ncbi:thiol-disulfide oxidoreductase DCC family protein [Shewanella japonica]|uniref:thiol-disulfide oxidoreductase DCC family protein n=1 Tax=Shewanella japonica TaxID=93973 RepID=UPI00249415EC|nr:DCC1-like thiol-disulfide oxidoreductase family protein [Shewanella japonica]
MFDGVCNLCNGAVSFIIQRDHKDVFLFTPMQSQTAQSLIAKHQLEGVSNDSFILIKGDKFFLRSDAALEITKDISGFWYLCRGFSVLPKIIRDYAYRLVAKNRYRLFGKKQACMVPTAALQHKFLDQ